MEKDWTTIGKMGKLWEHMGQPYMGNYGKIWEHDGKHREIMGNQRNWSEMVYLVVYPHSNTTIKKQSCYHVHI